MGLPFFSDDFVAPRDSPSSPSSPRRISSPRLQTGASQVPSGLSVDGFSGMGSKKRYQAFTWNGVEETISGVYLEWDRRKVIRRLPGMGSKKRYQAFTWNGIEER